MDKTPPTTIRLSDEDKALINELKRRYGIRSTTQLIKVALRLMFHDRNISPSNVAPSVAQPESDTPPSAS